MGLVVYNTLSRSKEDFVPLQGKKVNFYACGVTVYDMCHIGHARSAITFDIVFRYLKHKGYEVNYVRNFTDIDDKIIKRANENDQLWSDVAAEFINEFYTDMDSLGVQRPTSEPKATEYIDQIISMISTLVRKKFAYVRDGDVYYSVKSFKEYGKLSRKNLDDLEAGARVNINDQKKDPEDFALWKASKPGEPWWDSPWGKGRPGWHIECSAMSTDICGPTLDIHGGGKDLVFPHHENEIAQSEATTDQVFVKYWLHNGFVNINHEKMSKSLGNFFTIREIREKYSSEAIRQFLLGTHYRNPIDFADQYLQEAQHSVDRLYATWEAAEKALAGRQVGELPPEAELVKGEPKFFKEMMRIEEAFFQAMDDDFNTAKAMGFQFELVKAVNSLAAGNDMEDWPQRLPLLKKAFDLFITINDILGAMVQTPDQYRQTITQMSLAKSDIDPARIEEMIAARNQARDDKNWAEADRIRDELAALKIVLKDSKEGTTWTVG